MPRKILRPLYLRPNAPPLSAAQEILHRKKTGSPFQKTIKTGNAPPPLPKVEIPAPLSFDIESRNRGPESWSRIKTALDIMWPGVTDGLEIFMTANASIEIDCSTEDLDKDPKSVREIYTGYRDTKGRIAFLIFYPQYIRVEGFETLDQDFPYLPQRHGNQKSAVLHLCQLHSKMMHLRECEAAIRSAATLPETAFESEPKRRGRPRKKTPSGNLALIPR